MVEHRAFSVRPPYKEPSRPPFLLKYRCAKGFVSVTVAIGIFTDLFLYSVIVPVIPYSLSERAGIPQDQVQYWVSILLAVYGAALLASSPFAGWIADRSSSRRVPYMCGLFLLCGATIMLCLGRSIAVLVAARILQGLSATVVWVVGLTLVVDAHGPSDVGRAMGTVSLGWTISILVGPMLGGIVYERAGYYAVYYMCFGLIVLDIALRLLLIEKKTAEQWLDSDDEEIQRPTLQQAAAELQQPIAEEVNEKDTSAGPSNQQTSPSRPVSPDPSSTDPSASRLGRLHTLISKLPPVLMLLTSRRLLCAIFSSLVSGTIISAFDSVLPLYARDTFSWSSTYSGLIFLAIIIPSFLSPLIGHYVDRFGPRWILAGGFAFSCPLLVLLRFVTHADTGQIVLLCALLTLLGFTMALTMIPTMGEFTLVVAAKEKKQPGIFGEKGAYAQAYALFNMAYAGGILVGPLWGGLVVNEAGWATMVWSLGLLSGVMALFAACFAGGAIWKKGKRWMASEGQEVREERTEVVERGGVK